MTKEPLLSWNKEPSAIRQKLELLDIPSPEKEHITRNLNQLEEIHRLRGAFRTMLEDLEIKSQEVESAIEKTNNLLRELARQEKSTIKALRSDIEPLLKNPPSVAVERNNIVYLDKLPSSITNKPNGPERE